MNRRSFTSIAALGLGSLGMIPASHAATSDQHGGFERLLAACDAVRASQTRQDAFNAWSRAVQQTFPFVHATALTVRHEAGGDPRPGAVRRIYSTVPESYPVGGWKHLSGSDWANTVLVRREVLVASGDADLRHYFPDHELLRSLGTVTLVNVPVVCCERAIGAFAFMCGEPLTRAAVTDELILLTALAAPLFVADVDENAS